MKTHWYVSVLSVALCFQAGAQAPKPAEAKAAAPKPVVESAVVPVPRNDGSKARFDVLTDRVKQNEGEHDIIFIGDSITQGWEGAGKDAWAKLNEKYTLLNLGIGGDRTQHVLWRLDNGHAKNIFGKVTVLMIGTNNSGDDRNSGEEIVDGVTAVVRKTQEKFPNTKILLLGIFPRGEKFNAQRGKILQVNQALQHLADDKKVFWLDIGHIFIKPDGSIPKDIMPDFLHLSPRGYEMWAQAIDPKLKELLR